MGFSWGGVNAMATAFGKKSKNPPIELSNAKFAAHIAFYPVCDVWVKNGIASRSVDLSTPTGAPVQIHNGTRDDYDTAPNICESLKTAHPLMPIELLMYEDATHGFDSANAQAVQFYDPVAKNGKGGQVKVIGDEQARSRAKASVLDFLRRSLPKH
jgi:dienelactone hydrolase